MIPGQPVKIHTGIHPFITEKPVLHEIAGPITCFSLLKKKAAKKIFCK
jgi:hypothetical protein